MTWQFWLDVGGTFTDCLARPPDGRLLRRKVLSSARVKGQATRGSIATEWTDPLRTEPHGFWNDYRIDFLPADGAPAFSATVIDFVGETGRFRIEPHRSPSGGQALTLSQNCAYELFSPEEAPILAIRLFLGLDLNTAIPTCSVHLGTTRGTNALLTRRGAKTALVTTRGFADVLAIGYQNRPQLFALDIQKPEPLYAAVAEIDERIAADGRILSPATEDQIACTLLPLQQAGIESLAICLLNSYVNATHECLIERVALEMGFHEVSVSSRVAPMMKIVPRGDTAVVDAYLNPVLRSYVERLKASLGESELHLMTSAGGLATPDHFSGKDSILSGPAGGVIGFSRVAQAAGFPRAIGFDMGGTSTDVARYDGRYEYDHESQKAGVRIVTPMLAIETVAAGGGSICRYDGVKLVVGPDSAGANPGPACYGRGGPLTVTDCNLALGRIVPDHFIFPLDAQAAHARLDEIVAQLKSGHDRLPLAAGFVRIANANMAAAIRSISLAKGYDPRHYVLAAFGSAGPQHACAVAREIGIDRVLIHPEAGVLSALGIGLADVVKHRLAGVYQPLNTCSDELPALFERLEKQVRDDVAAESTANLLVEVQHELDLRYQGADAILTIQTPADGDFAAAFAAEHRRRYGYVHSSRPVEVVAARVKAMGRNPLELLRSKCLPPRPAHSVRTQPLFVQGEFQEVPLYEREQLIAGSELQGPALIVEPLTTTIVDPGWRATVLSGGELLLTDLKNSHTQSDRALDNPQSAIRNPESTAQDPVLLEIVSNHFTAIATQMGITLRNTSMSVNVKERLDFSCAVFTPSGDLVVNAPHIPVHLGAMAMTVKAILADNPAMQPGDVFVTNDPYRGGSHLPDVTVVSPVFSPHSPNELLFFTASRAHHAEIGGLTPGSMPPFSKNLAEEGVLIGNFKLIAAGQDRLASLRELLLSGPYPSRDVESNLADLTAQVAANQQGACDLILMIERYSWSLLQAYMGHIQTAAETKLRTTLARLPPGTRRFMDYLDDGTPICVAITIEGGRATIDFTGTGPVSRGNLNANRAIVTAAVMYVLRLLVGEDIPLNQGLLAPVEIVLPACLLDPRAGATPQNSPAVVGGNVETSQRVVDVLLGALGLAAASQGTMNNVLFGDDAFGYYETICGGSGATAHAPGADAVHTHMTNTRITDPEVLEARYPVRLREFSVRRGSGGEGANRGGDGIVRRIEFLRPLTLSILSQRRGAHPPYGMHGGQPGKIGCNSLRSTDGSERTLEGMTQQNVHAGDVLTVQTPGGGGWGAPQELPSNNAKRQPTTAAAAEDHTKSDDRATAR